VGQRALLSKGFALILTNRLAFSCYMPGIGLLPFKKPDTLSLRTMSPPIRAKIPPKTIAYDFNSKCA